MTRKWLLHVNFLGLIPASRFYSLGPSSGVGSGSLIVVLEKQIDYITAVIAKLQRERIKTIEVKEAAVKDFDEYIEVRCQHIRR